MYRKIQAQQVWVFFVDIVAVLLAMKTEQLEQNLTCQLSRNTNAPGKFIHLNKNVHLQ
jgi:hypothetical protein